MLHINRASLDSDYINRTISLSLAQPGSGEASREEVCVVTGSKVLADLNVEIGRWPRRRTLTYEDFPVRLPPPTKLAGFRSPTSPRQGNASLHPLLRPPSRSPQPLQDQLAIGGMRSHFILLQASCYYFALLLPFILGVSGQTGVTSPPPSSSSSSSTPSSSPSSGGSSLSSSTSGVSLGVTGTPTGTADFPTLSGYSECGTSNS